MATKRGRRRLPGETSRSFYSPLAAISSVPLSDASLDFLGCKAYNERNLSGDSLVRVFLESAILFGREFL